MAGKLATTINAGGYVDGSDADVKKGLNQMFAEGGGAQALVKGDNTGFAPVAYTWQKSNVIAPDAKQALQDMTRSPDDAVMLRGLTYLDQLQRNNPAGFDAAFGAETAKLVQRYNDLNGYVPSNKIAETMRSRMDPAWIKTKEPLAKAGAKLAEENYAADDVLGLFDDRMALNYFSSGPSAVAGDVEAMASDFRRLYADFYAETGGDADLAERNATAALKRVWAPSELNGGKLTRYAFENYYPTLGTDHSWAKDALEADLKGLGYVTETGTAPRGKGGTPATAAKTETVRPYELRAIPLTEAQIAAGVRPQYSVIVTDPETGIQDAVTDKEGSLMVWPGRDVLNGLYAEKKAKFLKENEMWRSIVPDATGPSSWMP